MLIIIYALIWRNPSRYNQFLLPSYNFLREKLEIHKIMLSHSSRYLTFVKV